MKTIMRNSNGNVHHTVKPEGGDMKSPEIGDWYTFCCHEDLHQIENQEDLDDVVEELGQPGGSLVDGIWPDQLTALQTIRGWWERDGHPAEVAECDELIRRIKIN